MKARLESNQIRSYNKLPSRYRSETLNIAGGFNKMPIQIHEQEGFFNLITPDFDFDIQKLGEVYFDEETKVFTYPLIAIVFPSLDAAKTTKIRELKDAVKDLYTAIQSYITEKQIHGETIPVAVKNKIKSIRTKYLLIKSQINALTTVVEVIKFELPYEAIESLKKQLEAIE